ncbi:MAG TPA: hypothetical protein DEQ48_00860 [Helicobacter sp.]|nr:hypothetical protein [Helicobacter sp.]
MHIFILRPSYKKTKGFQNCQYVFDCVFTPLDFKNLLSHPKIESSSRKEIKLSCLVFLLFSYIHMLTLANLFVSLETGLRFKLCIRNNFNSNIFFIKHQEFFDILAIVCKSAKSCYPRFVSGFYNNSFISISKTLAILYKCSKLK